MATKVRATYTITGDRHRVTINIDFATPSIGDFTSQDLVIYSGGDEELAKKLVSEATMTVHSGGYRVIRDGVEEP